MTVRVFDNNSLHLEVRQFSSPVLRNVVKKSLLLYLIPSTILYFTATEIFIEFGKEKKFSKTLRKEKEKTFKRNY